MPSVIVIYQSTNIKVRKEKKKGGMTAIDDLATPWLIVSFRLRLPLNRTNVKTEIYFTKKERSK